eukprot:TRINITY_DN3159_c2_g3_i1.p1 TRINITY_DN3159_c2_g3~~TRINITY_DN3159_c2_g3_i1.p1  ORF type:complete len:92 (-),score=21.80 TRINITY_DN3159_c2_g3_i1:102-377(-)
MTENNYKPIRTPKYLTKYEKARVIGARAQQIAMNAQIGLSTEEIDPIKIAEEELSRQQIKMIIRRYLPDGTHEDVLVSELNSFSSTQSSAE